MRAPRSIIVLLYLTLVFPFAAGIGAEVDSGTKVGEAGDPDNLMFEGLQSFSDRQIRRALAVKPSYLLVAHPQAELQPFLDELRKKVQTGYQAVGFPDAWVEVSFDSRLHQAHIKIAEGPHFEAGQIRVIGARSSSVPELVRWFTTAADESETASGLNTPGKATRPEDPIWEIGGTADFTLPWLTQVVAQVEAGLAEQGFFFPKAKVELQRNARSGAADLVIALQDEGPISVVDQIKVTGAHLHSTKDIIEFLRLRPGQRLTTKRLAEARRKLFDCGRFWYFTVTPEYAQEGGKVSSRRANLLVEVKELEGIPHLHKPLTPTQQALVRFCEWLERFPSRADELDVKVSSTNVIPFDIRMVVSPKHGFLINSSDLRGASPISAGIELTDKMLQLTAWATGVKIARENNDTGCVFLRLLPNNDDESTNRFNLSFGAGFSKKHESRPAQQKSPLSFDIQIMRAALLDLATRTNGYCRLEAGQLVASTDGFGLRADARTGQLIRIDASGGGMALQVGSGTRLWPQASGDFERRAAPLTNVFVPGDGFTTFLNLAAAEALRWKLTTAMNSSVTPDERTRAVSALRRLLDPELRAVDQQYFSDDKTNSFHVPSDALDQTMAQDKVLEFFTSYLFAGSRELFPKHSWPRTVARETAFVLMNQSRYTSSELERLCKSEETGPIGFLVIAQSLANVDPETAKNIALDGLTRLSAQDFRRDCNLFLRGESGLARSFSRLARALRALPDAELTALANVLPENYATLLRESAAALRTQPDAQLDLVLSPAISKYWDQCLRTEVRTCLFELAKPGSQSNDAK